MFYLVRNLHTGEVEVIEQDKDPSYPFLVATADEAKAYRIATETNDNQ
jgi:hypothetical protein